MLSRPPTDRPTRRVFKIAVAVVNRPDSPSTESVSQRHGKCWKRDTETESDTVLPCFRTNCRMPSRRCGERSRWKEKLERPWCKKAKRPTNPLYRRQKEGKKKERNYSWLRAFFVDWSEADTDWLTDWLTDGQTDGLASKAFNQLSIHLCICISASFLHHFCSHCLSHLPPSIPFLFPHRLMHHLVRVGRKHTLTGSLIREWPSNPEVPLKRCPGRRVGG